MSIFFRTPVVNLRQINAKMPFEIERAVPVFFYILQTCNRFTLLGFLFQDLAIFQQQLTKRVN